METLAYLLLALHISGALVTGIIGGAVLIALATGRAAHYRMFAVLLASLASFEVLSGSLLSVVSYTVSLASVCERLGAYLTAVIILESFLLAALARRSIRFDSSYVYSPLTLSLTASVGILATALAR